MKRLDNDSVINRFIASHSYRYDYSLVEYHCTNTKVKIECRIHGIFEQTPSNHITGNGCPTCANKNMNTSVFIEKSIKIHGDRYDLSLVDYKLAIRKVKIICKQHGEFKVTPNAFLTGTGCAGCSGNKKGSTEDFVRKANEIHNSYYDYSQVKYTNNSSKVIIRCPIHGRYDQTPNKHINRRQGCSNCKSNNNVSSQETIWLDSLDIPLLSRQMRLPLKTGGHFKADGYDSKTNTVYEYFGDYWHGNPNRFNSTDINQTIGKTFGELYSETVKKISNIQETGYNLVYVWENRT